jgi:hypothetical protein
MRLGALLAAWAVGVGLAGIGHASDPPTVTVRLIDARNGKPYTLWKGPYQISLYKADPSRGFNSDTEARANDLGIVRQVPDANGEVRFALPDPMPGVIRFDTPLGCSYQSFDAKEVVEKGVVGKNECRTKFAKMNVKFEAKPREMIYFVAPLSFWERHPIIR